MSFLAHIFTSIVLIVQGVFGIFSGQVTQNPIATTTPNEIVSVTQIHSDIKATSANTPTTNSQINTSSTTSPHTPNTNQPVSEASSSPSSQLCPAGFTGTVPFCSKISTTTSQVSLSITMGQVTFVSTEDYSGNLIANLSWTTNIPTNSKVLLTAPASWNVYPQELPSSAGYSIHGFAKIGVMDPGAYSYTIEAADGNQIQKLTGSFNICGDNQVTPFYSC